MYYKHAHIATKIVLLICTDDNVIFILPAHKNSIKYSVALYSYDYKSSIENSIEPVTISMHRSQAISSIEHSIELY